MQVPGEGEWTCSTIGLDCSSTLNIWRPHLEPEPEPARKHKAKETGVRRVWTPKPAKAKAAKPVRRTAVRNRGEELVLPDGLAARGLPAALPMVEVRAAAAQKTRAAAAQSTRVWLLRRTHGHRGVPVTLPQQEHLQRRDLIRNKQL